MTNPLNLLKKKISSYVAKDLQEQLDKEIKKRKQMESLLEKILYDDNIKLPVSITLDIFETIKMDEFNEKN